MGYFSNGTEGMDYYARWCERCVHDREYREKRAMGPLVKGLQREGLIRPTGTYRKSREVGCHARPKAVWRWVGSAARARREGRDGV